jgi:CheY-like chemotaxis protein
VEQGKKSIRIDSIVKEALNLLKASLPAFIKIQTRIQTCSPVLADPTQIHQVVMNLCTNAFHAMEEGGGTLTVSLEQVPLFPEDLAHTYTLVPGEYNLLKISDTGTGIKPHLLERIFEPYFTTKPMNKGTGLGLSVVHGIVKSHGGEILVESEPGRGTSFHVLFPLVKAEEQVQEYDRNQEVVGGTERILLVDDEPLLVDLMERSLRLLGYRVESFTDSAAALAWLKEHDGEIDLVITDMTMPGLTGAELAEAVLACNPAMPIILCTGYSEEMDAQKARELGISRFVAKPVDNRELALTIREVLDGSGSKP